MISRHWSGLARLEHAATYQHHLATDTFPALRALPGFVSAAAHARPVPDGVEFVVITHWDSLDAIRAFAGDDLELAVVPVAVQAIMVRYDDRARHYDIAVNEIAQGG